MAEPGSTRGLRVAKIIMERAVVGPLIKCREDIIGELDFGNGRPTRGGVTDCHTLERKCKTMKNIEADVVSRGV